MRLGFSGTRDGMTAPQLDAFRAWLLAHWPAEFHVGLCLGSDEQATLLVDAVNATCERPRCLVVGHPPVIATLRSQMAVAHCDELRPAKGYLARDEDIVAESDLLAATPKHMTERRHGGTWWTVGCARKAKRPVIIFWADGTVTEEQGGR